MPTEDSVSCIIYRTHTKNIEAVSEIGAKSRTQNRFIKQASKQKKPKLQKLTLPQQFLCGLQACFINLVLRAGFSANIRNVLSSPLSVCVSFPVDTLGACIIHCQKRAHFVQTLFIDPLVHTPHPHIRHSSTSSALFAPLHRCVYTGGTSSRVDTIHTFTKYIIIVCALTPFYGTG
jgi:hypothetical protein